MLRKISLWIILGVTFLGASAFRLQDIPAVILPSNWAALAIVFGIILLAAILLIIQTRMTPSNTARYHLDHGEENHDLYGESSHTGSDEQAEHS